MSSPLKMTIKTIMSGLRKLEVCQQATLWRGCRPEILKYYNFKVGKVYCCDKAFLSASKKKVLLQMISSFLFLVKLFLKFHICLKRISIVTHLMGRKK
jgi:hypothetical protein